LRRVPPPADGKSPRAPSPGLDGRGPVCDERPAVKPEQIVQRFELFLRSHDLKLTAQRRRILDRAFATHEHFSAEEMYGWLKAEPGPQVSRATVYRTLALLQEGGFVEGLDAGRGELVYEHVLG